MVTIRFSKIQTENRYLYVIIFNFDHSVIMVHVTDQARCHVAVLELSIHFPVSLMGFPFFLLQILANINNANATGTTMPFATRVVTGF